ncbi:hypothetical protein ACNAW0_18860 [Micromonospora sp. SL1-18]|uniref:hypothetical protein n=1 Tax=Micromonospora sp. SL1-18 TaxID=3399128 RepID=UPI003A4DFA39
MLDVPDRILAPGKATPSAGKPRQPVRSTVDRVVDVVAQSLTKTSVSFLTVDGGFGVMP